MQPSEIYQESPHLNLDHGVSQLTQAGGVGAAAAALVPGQQFLQHPELTGLGQPHNGVVGNLSQHDDVLDTVRFHRQANGEGARERVIHERMPSRMSFISSGGQQSAPVLQQEIEQDVAELRSHNQLASLATQQLASVPQMTIGQIRNIPGMSDRVEMQWSNIRGQTPCLSAAPSASAPGLPNGQSTSPYQPPHVNVASPGTDLQQQLLTARTKFATVLQQKQVAEQQLYNQQLAQQTAAQAKDQAELMKYQQQIQEAEAHIVQVEAAFQQLCVAQPQVRVDPAPRRSVLRQVPGQPSPAQDCASQYVGSMRAGGQPAQAGAEIVLGADGRQYRVPRSAMSQVPEFEIVTGLDGRRYQVSRSQLSQVPANHQNYSVSPNQQQYMSMLQQQASLSPNQFPGAQSLPAQQPQVFPWQGRSVSATHPQQHVTPQSGYNGVQVSVPIPQHATAVGQARIGTQLGDQPSDRIKGIVNLSDSEGARKPAKLIDYVRRCPAKWCKQVKPTSMNLPVYGYGAVAELLDSMSGRSEPLSAAVQFAKLRHLRDVFEVCCINSADTEFCDYGWTLARDYALKVQDRVDQQQHSWETHTGIQSDVLLSAQMEFPRPAKKDRPKIGDSSDRDKPLCNTYNKCTTEGKCEYEVSSGRACIRKHECTWCRKNKKQSHKHQETKCSFKVAAGQ